MQLGPAGPNAWAQLGPVLITCQNDRCASQCSSSASPTASHASRLVGSVPGSTP